MNPEQIRQAEKAFYRQLNQIVEPLVLAGIGGPQLFPVGLILLETRGRLSGRFYRTPVVALRWGELLFVSTVRTQSQWVQNLAAHPEIDCWVNGRQRQATAYVFSPEVAPLAEESLPPAVQGIAAGLRLYSTLTRASLAVLDVQPV
ncbi:MAG: nitroreductase/quinone reductase family protein [Caldilinea sp.]|jgi:deazaflavin-dependent oxidoreductase (nitroreductase family)